MRSVLKPLPCFVLLAAGLASSAPADAYVVTINAGTTAVYLRVGDGTITGGTYNNGGNPGNNATVNVVSVTVPAAVVGNGVAQPMTATGRLTSDWDNYAFCNANQVYIGGFYRRTGTGTLNATLTAVAPPNLTNGPTNTIPISQISWTTSGNGDTTTQPIPAGTFTGGSQTLANNFQNNTWRESCMSFTYANQNLVVAGTYTATVTYTLTAP